MSMHVRGPGGQTVYSNGFWKDMLRKAIAMGWYPLGTVNPNWNESEEWDGNYTYNENQLMSYADIEAMVSALSKCRDIDVMLFTEELEAVATGDAVMLA